MSGFTELDGIIQDFSVAEEATIEGGRCGGRKHGKGNGRKGRNGRLVRKGRGPVGKRRFLGRIRDLEGRVVALEDEVGVLGERLDIVEGELGIGEPVVV